MGKTKCIMLILTYKCNLNCVYCYEPKELGHRMSIETAKKIIVTQLRSVPPEYDRVEIQFMGGEPLIEFDLIKELSEWLWSQDWGQYELVLFASTNGTLLDNEKKEWLSKNKERIVLGLSFDGNASMQNANRSHSSDSVDLNYFRDTWPNQSVKMTISPYTVSSLYDGIVYLHNHGCKYIIADLATGDKIRWSKESVEIYRDQLNRLVNFYIENIDLHPVSLLNFDAWDTMNRGGSYKTCSCGENLTCYDWDGEPYACHLFSPVAMSKEQAIKAREDIDFCNHKIFTYSTCKKCLLAGQCNSCPGMNYICSNDVSVPSVFHCRAFKISFVANCRLQLLKAEKNGDREMINKISTIVNNINL